MRSAGETKQRQEYADAINSFSRRYKLGRPKVQHGDADANLRRFIDESLIARRILGQWQPEIHPMSWQDGIRYLSHPSLYLDQNPDGQRRHRAELAAYRARQHQQAVDSGVHISDRGARFICGFEGYARDWYDDGVGVQTIGYGHTGPLPHGFRAPLSSSEALRLFKYDIGSYERAVAREVHAKVTQPQRDMLISFVYNGGPGWLTDDLGLAAHINRGDWGFVYSHWTDYSNPGDPNVHAGLLRRRQEEVKIMKRGGY